MILYSTRDKNSCLDALLAVVSGISPEGGLFVPKTFPKLTQDEILNYCNLTYPQLCALVLNKFFDELSIDELNDITAAAYKKFDTNEVAPLHKLTDSEYVLELIHGPTIAFKDMALQVLPRLLLIAKDKKNIDEITLVLVATSGDTGKAALDGFADVPNTKIVVFYPNDGVSEFQKLQMVTQEGKNTFTASVKGNFDDAQTGVKNIFANKDFEALLKSKNIKLSSANSINFGRLAPQVAYYISAYVNLVKYGAINIGEKINFTVPTGNFGNILAAYYAKKMGLPINKLICASNRNNVLTDFFSTGKYSANREFFKTISPSMDILISSNLERLLFEILDQDCEETQMLILNLKNNGEYELGKDKQEVLKQDFFALFASEEETNSAIKSTFEKYGYLIDPHTAVAQFVYEEYIKKTNDKTVNVVVSTASPYKFCSDVLNALNLPVSSDIFECAERLNNYTKAKIPECVMDLKGKKIIHTDNLEKQQMLEYIESIIK